MEEDGVDEDLDIALMLAPPAIASMIVINPICGRCGGVATHAMLGVGDKIDRIDALTVCEPCAQRIVRTLDKSHTRFGYAWVRSDVAPQPPPTTRLD